MESIAYNLSPLSEVKEQVTPQLCVSYKCHLHPRIPNSAVGIFSPKTEGTKTKAVRVLVSCYHANLEA
jgi:hypothetical protein